MMNWAAHFPNYEVQIQTKPSILHKLDVQEQCAEAFYSITTCSTRCDPKPCGAAFLPFLAPSTLLKIRYLIFCLDNLFFFASQVREQL